jgi:ketosteroid isomerase-like protein
MRQRHWIGISLALAVSVVVAAPARHTLTCAGNSGGNSAGHSGADNGGDSRASVESGSTQPEESLRAAETAFAKTMADRDLDAFSAFLSPEVVFFSGDNTLRGPEAVSQAWARFFKDPDAPFSWKPTAVAVLDSGTLGFSSGPVIDPAGSRIGTFNSVWRRSADGDWQIVFDRGCP